MQPLHSPVSFGLIGFGAWGKMHAAAIAATPGAVLRGIVARSPAARTEARELHPTAIICQEPSQLLELQGLEMVSVATPSHSHFDLAAAVLRAGKHLLLEKPMALSVPDCWQLIGMAKTQGRVLAVGHELRLSSQWGAIRRMITEGVIGTPQYCLVELSRKPYRLGSGGWRYDDARVGNWILEEPIHFFDLARWYLSEHGEPREVHAHGNSCDPSRPHLHDNFSALLRYDSGAYAVVTQTLAAFEHHQTVKVTGTKGSIWATWSGAMDRTREPVCSMRLRTGEVVQEVPLVRQSGEIFELAEEMAMCVRCVREGASPIAGGQDGLWSTGLCLAAAESIRRSAPVDVQDFIRRAGGTPAFSAP